MQYEECLICGNLTQNHWDGNPAIDGEICNYCKKYVIYARDNDLGKMSKKSKALVKQEFKRTGEHINAKVLSFEGKDEND